VSGVNLPREISGGSSRVNAVELPFGTNMTMIRSAASGAFGSKLSNGFNWNEGARDPSHWHFEDNVGHNNSGDGIRFWNNSRDPHHAVKTILYHNGIGIENGAYLNANRFTDILVLEGGILHQSSSNNQQEDDGPSRYTRVQVEVSSGPALMIGTRNLPSKNYVEFVDSRFKAGPGSPKVLVKRTSNSPWLAHFIRSGVTPDDIVFESLTDGNDGSHILIDHEDGRKWEIRVQNGAKVVKKLN
jgi:hypothetical protein